MRTNPLFAEGMEIVEDRFWGRKLLAVYLLFLAVVGLAAAPGQSLGFYMATRQPPSFMQAMTVTVLVSSAILLLAALSRLSIRGERVSRWILYTGIHGRTCAFGKFLFSAFAALTLVSASLPLLLFAANMNGASFSAGVEAGFFILVFLLSYGCLWSLLSMILPGRPVPVILLLWGCAVFQFLFSVRLVPEANPALSLLALMKPAAQEAAGRIGILRPTGFGINLPVLIVLAAILLPVSGWKENLLRRKNGDSR